MKYTVTARNTCREVVHLCDSPTQGRRMIPLACSMARRFPDRESADKAAREEAKARPGLSDWSVEPLPAWEEDHHEAAMREAFGPYGQG